jgi:hypothetical protein
MCNSSPKFSAFLNLGEAGGGFFSLPYIQCSSEFEGGSFLTPPLNSLPF